MSIYYDKDRGVWVEAWTEYWYKGTWYAGNSWPVGAQHVRTQTRVLRDYVCQNCVFFRDGICIKTGEKVETWHTCENFRKLVRA